VTDISTSRGHSGGVTIEDVARLAGVSRQTVSNTLNAPQRVKDETLKKVQAVIDGLGYRPDQSARSLKTGLRYTLAYMAPDDDPFNPNPLMGGFLTALCDAAASAGYRILLFRPTSAPRRAVDDLAAARQVDGFILSDITHDDPRVDRLADLGVPFVTFGRTAADKPQQWVDVDNSASMHRVATALKDHGHHRVAYIAPSSPMPWLQERTDGFYRGAAEANIEVTTVFEPPAGSEDSESLVVALKGLLESKAAPTAIAAANDLLAMTAYRAIREAGLAVGEDISVVGYNDLPLCQLLSPKLSSVRMPLPSIALEIVGQLLAQIQGRSEPGSGTLLASELIIRDSLQARRPQGPPPSD
jgi:DNA-binding LacI/PurR family transcriptional regulator